ncbi:hypothetical protein [Paenibacillus planticolens]|uniref:Uncharacterized protein n=1 Tax=Paenibacillus planticolens TaxID=2654976 RepID=A0ABX1ZQL8_9BACL|nr:hypothetical protein [Paenibacillus planticolens]NOV01325.1 hypothetical protein [Paenibacillus planticolens]
MSRTTASENDDITQYIILPMILDMIDKWMSWSEFTPLKHLHPEQFQELLDMITIDHVEVKQRLKTADIKVVKAWKPGATLDYKIFVRRYEENLSYWKGHIKSEISIALGKYVARLDKSKFKKLPDAGIEEKNNVFVDRKLFVNF